jgi:mono/diheme cytochrome c family protein
MLHETRAKWLALATALLVIAMAAVFAALRNQPPPAAEPRIAEAQPPAPEARPAEVPPPAVAADAKRAPGAAGRRAFERLNCSVCHAIGGKGNPGSPLDGIGGRLDRAAIRDWTTGSGAARDKLPAGIVRSKARAAGDPDLEALVDYLGQLK